jgi:glycosyltransferase involved in cell wall biosynthesis
MISVVIPAHNEERYLPGTLEALFEETRCAFECIVVPNGCADRTEEIAGQFPVEVVVVERANLSNARNVGAAHALYPYLLFLDADIRVVPGFLPALLRKAKERKAAVVLGDFDPDSPTPKAKSFLAMHNFFHQAFRGPMGFTFTRRDVFEKVGGYDEGSEPAEDIDYVRRALRHGTFAYLKYPRPIMSMRRFEKLGYVRTTLNWMTGPFTRGREYKVVR